jgi:hypothetical protein
MLGEASTTAIVKSQNPIGFTENKKVAKQGGDVAGNARKELEIKTGEKVISPTNYKAIEEKKTKENKIMIRFDNPHKMRVSQPIWELSLKKWGLYISYGQV